MTKKQNKAGIAALMLAVLFLILAIPAFADGGALTPEGNMTLTDDFTSADGDKQFITVKTADGDYYYIIIDRAGISQNVYFLRLVGENDLPADSQKTPILPGEPTCTCKERCTVGHIDASCPVCVADSAKCACKEEIATSSQQTPQQPVVTGNNTVQLVGIILLVAIGGVALYFVLKGKAGKSSNGSRRERPVTKTNRREEPEDEDDEDEFGTFRPDDDEDEEDD